MNKILLGMAAASALFFVSTANAGLKVMVDEITAGDTDAAVVIADGSALDGSALSGHITNTTSTANFNVVTSTAFGSELMTFPDVFDLAANVLSSGAGTLQVSLTETGLTGFDAAAMLGGGSLGGTGVFDLYLGDGNGEFEMSYLLTSGSYSEGVFSIETNHRDFSTLIDGPFSLTLVNTLTADDAGDYFSTDIKVVPEPSILALFGAGLFGLGLARRRMKK